VADFDREPCFWTSPTPGYNTRDRQRSFMKDGKRVTERFPQRGHAGDYENRLRAQGTRFIRIIDHHGHEIFHVLTNAAAHLDHTAPFGQYQMQKARFLGWFMPGQCPCALMATGEMKPDHIMSDEVRRGSPCAQGTYSYENQCPHSKAEQAARRAANKLVQDEREKSMKGDGALNLEATQAMTKTVTEAVTKLVELQAAQIEQPSETKKGK